LKLYGKLILGSKYRPVTLCLQSFVYPRSAADKKDIILKVCSDEHTDQILYLPQESEPNVEDFPCPDSKAFIQLVVNVSARMINAPAENLDQEIILALAEIFQSLDASRGGLLEVKEYPSVLNVSHAWYGSGVPHIPEDVNVVEHYPWAFHKIVVEKYILALTKKEAFPEEARLDQVSYDAFKNKSSLLIPLEVDERITHVFAVDVMTHECKWPVEIIKNLKLIGEIFVAALMRREQGALLLQYKNRMELAASSAEVGLWELDRKTGYFWATKQARAFFNFSDDEQITMDSFLRRVSDDDRSQIVGEVDRLSSCDEELSVEYRVSDPTGDRWMSSRGRLIPANGSGRDVLMGATIEITGRKKMEEELSNRLNEINELRQKLEAENLYLRSEISSHKETQGLLGSSPGMRFIISQIEQVARTNSTVMIQGETGTGKELIAQQIHQLSDRRKRTMIKVNCAALPASLVESELFGREKGAFTGALSKQSGRFDLANGSTLFLDEISEIPLEIQVKLLRVLQDGEFERLGSPQTIKVDVRVIAASNRDLMEEVRSGRFREDLFYRLNVFPLRVPPLRERVDDIPNLVWEFVNEFGERMGKKIRRISKQDMELLKTRVWPGNIRELRNVIEHALIVTQGDTLELQHFSNTESSQPQATTLEDVERQHILYILTSTNGRSKGVDGAADRLGLNPSTLYSRMRKLGIHTRLS